VTDEQQLRDLLSEATMLPDHVLPPVQRLLRQGRRRRNLRSGLRAIAVGVVAVIAVATPTAIRTLHAGRSGQTGLGPELPVLSPFGPPPAGGGPTAAELAKFRWTILPSSPLRTTQPEIVAWAGQYLLAIGGATGSRSSATGAAFDPATGRWHLMAAVPFPVNVADATSVWTGRQLFVTDFGASGCGCAGLYDPAANQWSTARLPKSLFRFGPMVATWTGSEVILAGVNAHLRLEVTAYSPATNRWQVITPRLPAGQSAAYATVVTTSSQLILWVMWQHVRAYKGGFSLHSGIDVFATDGDGGFWRDVTGSWPQGQTMTTPVLTGSALLVSPGQVWCGDACSPPGVTLRGYFARAATWRRTMIPLSPIDDSLPPYIWTGRAIIEMNDGESLTERSGERIPPYSTFAFDPASSRWLRLPTPPSRPTSPAVWTGTELLVLTDHGGLLALRH
jgi:hypothetical protein